MLVKLKQKLQLLLCDMVISNVDKKRSFTRSTFIYPKIYKILE